MILNPNYLYLIKDAEVDEQRLEEHVDDRSVDDLLSFINGDNEGKSTNYFSLMQNAYYCSPHFFQKF